MYVAEIKEIAREWVTLYGSQTPGFCGAHLMGSLNTMAQDAPFAGYKDVDMNIITRGAQDPQITEDVSYKGLILEYGILPLEHYDSPETVLADPGLASNIAAKSLLADPEGILSRLQPVVSQEFARRRWVKARLQWEKTALSLDLDAAGKFVSVFNSLVAQWNAGIHLAGGLTIAALKPPTHRRALVIMYELLKTHQRLDLHERTLNVSGYESLERSEVQAYLQQSAEAFDLALQVKKTPTPFDFKMHPYVRPYFVQGAQEMIDEGHHREAMSWIMVCYSAALFVIGNDAPPAEKKYAKQAYDAMLDRCGLLSAETWPARVDQTRKLGEEIFTLADGWVADSSDIFD